MAIKARPAWEICSRRLESCIYLPVLHHFPLPLAQVEVTDALNASVNSTCTQPPPGYHETFAHLVSPGGGAIANFAPPGGRAFANPGPFPSFWHTRGFLSEYNYTEGFTGKKKQIGSSVKDRNKLKRVVKACSRFYACISSLLIKIT